MELFRLNYSIMVISVRMVHEAALCVSVSSPFDLLALILLFALCLFVHVIALLDTLYLQFNDLTGVWPAEFCDPTTTTLREFGLDCDEVTSCTCCSTLNCYYSS
jgi:hypothetical protein